jgi:hypothetical protein
MLSLRNKFAKEANNLMGNILIFLSLSLGFFYYVGVKVFLTPPLLLLLLDFFLATRILAYYSSLMFYLLFG